MRSTRYAALAALAAATLAAPAQAQWFVGVQAGNGAADETGAFGVPVPGFGGPTVDHDLCGGTATITVGPEPTVTSIDANSTNYRVFVGARSGNWSLELADFNVARMEGSADSAPYSVAQPTCNPVPTDPITVDAFGRKLEQIQFNGWSLTPTYSLNFAKAWTVDFRATVAFWEREQNSQWQIVVTENSNGVPIQTYPTTWSNGSGGGAGVDLGYGLGIGWSINDDVRLRLQFEVQPYSEFDVSTVTLGFAIDLGD
jgi:hypothetical protein